MNVLILDDEPLTREIIRDYIPWNEMGFINILTAQNAMEALAIVNSQIIHIIISDICMPGMNGLEFVSQVKTLSPIAQIIFISGYCEKNYLQQAIRLGVSDFLEKPLNLQTLTSSIENAVHLLEQQKQIQFALENRKTINLINNENDLINNFISNPKMYFTKIKNILSNTNKITIFSLPVHNKDIITQIINLKSVFDNSKNHIIYAVIKDTVVIISKEYEQFNELFKNYLMQKNIYGSYISVVLREDLLHTNVINAIKLLDGHFINNQTKVYTNNYKEFILLHEHMVPVLELFSIFEFTQGIEKLKTFFTEISFHYYTDIENLKNWFGDLFLNLHELMQTLLNNKEFKICPASTLSSIHNSKSITEIYILLQAKVDYINTYIMPTE